MFKKAPQHLLYFDCNTFTNFLSRFPLTICSSFTFTNPLNTFSTLIITHIFSIQLHLQ